LAVFDCGVRHYDGAADRLQADPSDWSGLMSV
jgi:hypothetical protein